VKTVGETSAAVSRKVLRACIPLTILAFAVELIGYKRGWWWQPPWAFFVLGGAALAALALELGLTLPELRRPERRVARAARVLAMSGALAVAGAGSANWLMRLQGFAIVREGEAVPLHGGRHLRQFEAGALADRAEVDVVLQLAALTLTPADGGFWPEATILVARTDGEPARVVMTPDRSGRSGTLRFHHGAFGFAPRLVVLRGEETLLDATVMLETHRTDAEGVSFGSEIPVERAGLVVRGDVLLDRLDDRMKGHPHLRVQVTKDGALLGAGDLRPGHFADVAGGYRVGLAGMSKWVEIIVSRRTYDLPIRLGLAALGAGLSLWALAAWRRW